MLTCCRAADSSILCCDLSGLFGGDTVYVDYTLVSSAHNGCTLREQLPMKNFRVTDGVPGPASGPSRTMAHWL